MRIAAVYKPRRPYLFSIWSQRFTQHSTDNITWVRTSQALAAVGFEVDLVTDARRDLPAGPSGFRCLPFSKAKWADYQAVVTFFHAGYRTLAQEFEPVRLPVISNLGSLAGRTDDTPGVYYFGEHRRGLYEIQQQIQANSKLVVIQTEANLDWQRRLNRLGASLKRRKMRLRFLGSGNLDELARKVVTVLGKVPVERMWDYQYFADVGIVLAQGRVQRNESTKIYYCLRTGLPVVSEAPVPNNHVIREAGAGLIADYGDEEAMADMIAEAAHRRWDHKRAIGYILDHHTYEHRVALCRRAILRLGR